MIQYLFRSLTKPRRLIYALYNNFLDTYNMYSYVTHGDDLDINDCVQVQVVNRASLCEPTQQRTCELKYYNGMGYRTAGCWLSKNT